MSFVKFIPKCFSDAVVNGIIFLVSLSDCLLLVHRNKIKFGILIFYPAILLNLIIS